MADRAAVGQAEGGQAEGGPAEDDPAEDDPAEVDPAVADPAADQVATIAAGSRVEKATDPHTSVRGQRATDPRSTDPDAKGTGRRSIARGQPATVPLSIAHGLPATDPRLIARGGMARHPLIARAVTIGRLATAPGKRIGRYLTAHAANFGLSQIDLAEILARRKSVRDPRDLRETGRGRTDHAVTLDRPSIGPAAAAAAGLTRIVREGPAPMADATGHPAIKADRPARSTPARQGRRTSTRASSWVKATS